MIASILVDPKPTDESAHQGMVDFLGHLAPLVDRTLRPRAILVAVDHLELVLELIDGTEPLVVRVKSKFEACIGLAKSCRSTTSPCRTG